MPNSFVQLMVLTSSAHIAAYLATNKLNIRYRSEIVPNKEQPAVLQLTKRIKNLTIGTVNRTVGLNYLDRSFGQSSLEHTYIYNSHTGCHMLRHSDKTLH